MIDLSDLVLVLFDARHPEPGAMRDTLQHLVVRTKNRADSSKFLHILNQLDTAAKEDNPEDVVAAWLRALGEVGMTTGRFYTVYSGSAPGIEDPAKRERFERKRDADLNEIYERMDEVEIERAYRIVASLRQAATDFADETVPLLETALRRWRARTFIADFAVLIALIAAFLFWSISSGHWQGLSYEPAWLETIEGWGISWALPAAEALAVLVFIAAHFGLRKLAALSVRPWLRKQLRDERLPGNVMDAFQDNTRNWQTFFFGKPMGWNQWTEGRIAKVLHDCESYVQNLNERFTNPRGIKAPPAKH
jgi:hypothetical protein